ncbi:hypothetical protein [Nibricoccus sp. IMCC34717]|uniref:hypothetical protein n=1 Tax=Nibricoccus sp. IMCC34717 TaxID=3034021 RepID=UPI00384A78A9
MPPIPSPAQALVNEVVRLFPEFMNDPIDAQHSGGNAVVLVIDADGEVHGRFFGADRARVRWCFGIAQRKVQQVWATGHATGRFEELVYSGKLDEGKFGVNRPDFIGWEGGVPFRGPDGRLIAAAFSGFRGTSDIAILERAAAAVPGLVSARNEGVPPV